MDTKGYQCIKFYFIVGTPEAGMFIKSNLTNLLCFYSDN